MKEHSVTPEAPANGLERRLGLFPLTNSVIANMIGAGIFTTYLIRGPLYITVFLLLLFPQILGSLAYFMLFFQVKEKTQPYPSSFMEHHYLVLKLTSGWNLRAFGTGLVAGLSAG